MIWKVKFLSWMFWKLLLIFLTIFCCVKTISTDCTEDFMLQLWWRLTWLVDIIKWAFVITFKFSVKAFIILFFTALVPAIFVMSSKNFDSSPCSYSFSKSTFKAIISSCIFDVVSHKDTLSLKSISVYCFSHTVFMYYSFQVYLLNQN